MEVTKARKSESAVLNRKGKSNHIIAEFAYCFCTYLGLCGRYPQQLTSCKIAIRTNRILYGEWLLFVSRVITFITPFLSLLSPLFQHCGRNICPSALSPGCGDTCYRTGKPPVVIVIRRFAHQHYESPGTGSLRLYTWWYHGTQKHNGTRDTSI